jgi:phosphoribosylanthranilate isomerase
MTRVKICGIKSLEQATVALEAGADYLGFIFYPPSHRYMQPAEVGKIVAACRTRFGGSERWGAVGVFVDVPLDEARSICAEAKVDLAQLCGHEDKAYAESFGLPIVRVVSVDGTGTPLSSTDPADHGAVRVMLDTKEEGRYGGTGVTYPWTAVRSAASEAFLAGGLTTANVSEAILTACPWAVDVSSGVERDRVKDPALVRAFISEVRRVDVDRG